MRQRRSTIRQYRRPPALAAIALVALAPMMPVDVSATDDGADHVDQGDVAAEPDAPEGEDVAGPVGGPEAAEEIESDDTTVEAGSSEEAGEIDLMADPTPDGENEAEEGELETDDAAGTDCEVGLEDREVGIAAAAGTDCEDWPDVEDGPDGEDGPAAPVVPEPVVPEPVVTDPVVPEPAVSEPVVPEPVVPEPVVTEPDVTVPAAPEPAEVVPTAEPELAGPASAGERPAERTAEPTVVETPADAAEVTITDGEEIGQEIGEFGEFGDGERIAPDPGDPGLRAERYDGVYAQGVPVWVAMTATRFLESRGDYNAQARGSTASGAYQVIDSTWNRYGGYARAIDAPAAVQDQFAYESMVAILKRFGNDVSAIPLAWYYPASLRNPALMDVVPVPQAGNVLTPRQYQARWMSLFHQHLEEGSPVFLPADSDPLIPAIAFPVLGPTSFWDDWHADRDGGARRHEGLDFMGENGQPLRAAFDGVVTRLRPTDVGNAGVGITITRADGIRANYFHLDAGFRWHADLDVGDTVKAGQVIAFMGDTGNAGIPHLHFELRTEAGEPIAPYPAALEAIQREQCSVGIGPWSTAFSSPAEITASLADAAEAAAAAATAAAEARAAAGLPLDAPLEALPALDEAVAEPVVHEIEGPDGARWTISDDGAVTAFGVGALVAPKQGNCEQVPLDEFGTGAAGLGLDLLPEEWWGDDVDPDDLAEMVAAVAGERSHEFDPALVDPSVAAVRLRLGGGDLLAAVSHPHLLEDDRDDVDPDVATSVAAVRSEPMTIS